MVQVLGKLKKPNRVMKLPPKTLRSGTTSKRKTTSQRKSSPECASAEIDDLRFELTGDCSELPSPNEPALDWNKSNEKEQDHTAQRRRLVNQRRLLPRQVDNLGRVDVKAPGHAEQKLGFKAAEDADHTEQKTTMMTGVMAGT